ncbi:hypothetical protein CCM_00795 [Cordyceps militaris CM01]|uniref:Uncharacterized protein n=1 Tax=Cordyceps militaris (strain CM01) TaxID=983644 RepID=G3J636_CORMM|nr:uncharacterized protein CCM_00795 [Cordyceps militaris CM01]EGX96140.1 hypothetical protein CCM_00795 [Cordyceps militaris CM01]
MTCASAHYRVAKKPRSIPVKAEANSHQYVKAATTDAIFGQIWGHRGERRQAVLLGEYDTEYKSIPPRIAGLVTRKCILTVSAPGITAVDDEIMQCFPKVRSTPPRCPPVHSNPHVLSPTDRIT